MENKLEKIGQNSFMDKVDWLQNSRRRIRWRWTLGVWVRGNKELTRRYETKDLEEVTDVKGCA